MSSELFIQGELENGEGSSNNSIFENGNPADYEHDRLTWPFSRASSQASPVEADTHGVSPSLDGFIKAAPHLAQQAERTRDGHGGSQPSTPGTGSDGVTGVIDGYLSDTQLPRSKPAARQQSLASRRHAKRPQQHRPNKVMKHAIAAGTVAPGQPAKVRRSKKSKFLQVDGLPQDDSDHWEEAVGDRAQPVQVTAYCAAFELDLVGLHGTLEGRFGRGNVTAFPEGSLEETHLAAERTPDILHSRYLDESGRACGDIICFEFGIVIMWNLSSGQEAEVVWQTVGPHMLQRVPDSDIEVDEFEVQIGPPSVRPYIQDDTIVMKLSLYNDVHVRVGISLALAQSTRISVQESQVMEMVLATRDLPDELVKTGAVSVSHEELAILIGRVFLQKTALNLQVLSGPKETPKFFWGRPDHLQRMYHAMSDYLDLEERSDILNRRFSALTEMLDVLRDQQSSLHDVSMEWMVIWLIFITTCLGLLQIASLMLGESTSTYLYTVWFAED